MKTKTTRVALAALLLLAVTALAACGSSDKTGGSASTKKPTGNSTDRAFIAEMVPHHRSAVAMAAMAKTRATSSFVKTLAANITRSQSAEIAQMQRVDAQLSKAGVKKGDLGMDSHMKGMDMNASMLEHAKPFDSEFMKMMVPHHKGAIAMAKIELAKGSNPELKTLAKSIISAQQREVEQMNAHLTSKASIGGMPMSKGHSG